MYKIQAYTDWKIKKVYALHPTNISYEGKNNKVIIAGNVIADGHHALYSAHNRCYKKLIDIVVYSTKEIYVEDINMLYDENDNYKLYHEDTEILHVADNISRTLYEIIMPTVRSKSGFEYFLQDAAQNSNIKCFFQDISLQLHNQIINNYSYGIRLVAQGVATLSDNAITISAQYKQYEMEMGVWEYKGVFTLNNIEASEAANELGTLFLQLKTPPQMTLNELEASREPIDPYPENAVII